MRTLLIAASLGAAVASTDADANASRPLQRDSTLAGQVLDLDVAFHWIPGQDRFWFKRQTGSGQEIVAVDAATGGQRVVSETEAQRCCVPARATATPDLVVSPDGRMAILRKGDNLWLRTLTDGQERPLTHDGQPNFGYGDLDHLLDTNKVSRRRTGTPAPLQGVLWSPDSQLVIALRQDLRPYPRRLLVTEYVPPNGIAADGDWSPTHFGRFAIAADPKTPETHVVIIDVARSVVRPVKLDPQALNHWALGYLAGGVLWWAADHRSVYLITSNRGGSRVGLVAVDTSTGNAKQILEESAPFNVRLNPHDYSKPNVFVLSDGKEFLWYSERSGYGHLYLYDSATGAVRRQLTTGEWVVFDLLHVDEEQRLAYFAAGPRGGGNPYYAYLYRVSLDGGAPQLLTPEVAHHSFRNPFGSFVSAKDGRRISPSGRYVIDSYSATDRPPKVVLRRASGEFVADILQADASALYGSGWRPPERVVVNAADGTTDLHGVIYRPRNFDPAGKYPVINYMYPGPQGRFAPVSFLDNFGPGSISNPQLFADAGFVVVVIDGRGTAYRSRAFRDAFLGAEDVFGAADHVAAIRQLAARYPHMDAARVGVMGHSFGGYGSLRAMLLHPDVFKVGVSSVGPGAWLHYKSGISVERFFGVPAASAEARAYYEVVSNTRLASRLQGRVLLVYGGIDENVPLKHAFVLFDAFIKADKDIDMLILPDSSHGAFAHSYALRRCVNYFVEHLAGRDTTQIQESESAETLPHVRQ